MVREAKNFAHQDLDIIFFWKEELMSNQLVWLMMNDHLERQHIAGEIKQFLSYAEVEVVHIRTEKAFMEELEQTKTAPTAVIAQLNMKYCTVDDTRDPNFEIPANFGNGGCNKAGVRCINAVGQKFPKTFTMLIHGFSDEYAKVLCRGLYGVERYEIFGTNIYLPKLAKHVLP